MPIDLYQVPGSAPCRAVQLTAAAIGLDLNLKFTDLMAGEHLKPEFLKVICDNKILYNAKHLKVQDDSSLKKIYIYGIYIVSGNNV